MIVIVILICVSNHKSGEIVIFIWLIKEKLGRRVQALLLSLVLSIILRWEGLGMQSKNKTKKKKENWKKKTELK